MKEITLGGYVARHDRAPAFEGTDGRAYSVEAWADPVPDERGRYGAAILFIRWSEDGTAPDGHHESDWLAWGGSPEEAVARLDSLSLYDIKAMLDERLAAGRPEGF